MVNSINFDLWNKIWTNNTSGTGTRHNGGCKVFHLIKSLTSLYITITLDTASPLIDQTPIVYCTSKPRETETYGILLFSLFSKNNKPPFYRFNPLGMLGEHSTFSQHSKWVFPPVNRNKVRSIAQQNWERYWELLSKGCMLECNFLVYW